MSSGNIIKHMSRSWWSR